jgi:hypothetical protein
MISGLADLLRRLPIAVMVVLIASLASVPLFLAGHAAPEPTAPTGMAFAAGGSSLLGFLMLILVSSLKAPPRTPAALRAAEDFRRRFQDGYK